MGCPQCDEIQQDCDCIEEHCNCDKIYSTICIVYEGVKLTLLDTYDGQNLESILINIDALFQDIFDKLNGSLYTNIGNGAKVFKKVNHLTQAEFRSILSSDSIDIVENLNDIGVSVNETWLSNFILGTDIETTTTVTNVITGKRIATYTNEDGVLTNINETITTLTDNGNGTFTYTNENGVPTTVDYSSSEVLTTITNTKVGNRIATYTNENSTTVDINETVTTLSDNNDNSLTYTNESGGTSSYTPQDSSTAQKGIVELATSAETQTGTDTIRAITPSGLSSRTATETRTGILEVATQAEANALILDNKIITPAKIPLATTSQRGLAEIATQAEVTTGTDTTKYVTPATLEQKVSSISSLISQEYETTISTWSFQNNFTFAHGLGEVPKIVQVMLVAKTSANGYSAGEHIWIDNVVNVRPDTPQWYGIRVSSTSSTLEVRIGLSIVLPVDPNSEREMINDSNDQGGYSIKIRAFS